MRADRPALALLLGLLSGCFSTPVPEDALLTCGAADECPEGFGCALEVGLCIPSQVLASPGPQLVGTASVTPSLARAGVEVRVAFQADQRLAEPPVVTLEGTDFAFALVAEESDEVTASYVYRASIAAGAPAEGSHSVVAAVKSVAGRPAVLRLGTLVVDRTPNRTDGGLGVNAIVGAGGSATLTFSVVEAVDDDHLPRVFFIDENVGEGEPWELVSHEEGASFTFRYTVPLDPMLEEGVHEVRVVLLDNAGNESVPLPAGTVTLDMQPPLIVESSVSITPSPLGGAPLLVEPVRAAGADALVTLTFTTDEELGADPTVMLTCPNGEPVDLERAPGDTSRRFFRYQLRVVDDITPEGDCTAVAQLMDLAGNASVVLAGEIFVDHTPPEALVSTSGSGATLARAPWGATDLDGDGVPDHGTMLLLDPPAEPGLVAVVFESATGGVLARGPAGTPLHLGALDRRDVSVAAIDAAGNLSPILAVRRGLWVATLGDKVPNSALENPHRGVLHSALPASLGDEGLEVGAELAGADGITATSSAMPRWHAGPQGEATSLPRYLPAYAWDDARGVAVAFGGLDDAPHASNAAPTDTTWEWNGRTWRRVSHTIRPSARYGATLAYDRQRGVMVLHGGMDGAGNVLDDTWELDTVWRRRDVSGPSPRGLSQSAYDPIRGEVVLFGGEDETGTLLDDTWTYDGTAWTQRPASAPIARSRAGMAFDETRGVVVLFGGKRQSADLSAWEWNGSTWTQRALTAPPLGDFNSIHEHRLTFDPVRQKIAMLMMNFLQSFELGVYTLGESGWESLPTNGALSRAGAVFFADPTRKELVLAGGDASATTQALGYGATAFARADLRPGIRSRLGAAFDPVNGVPLLFAGMNTATAQNDTWTYDGNRFHRIDSYSHPFVSGNEGVRYGGFAYSFGGVSAGGWTNELRRFTGTSWTVVTTSGTAPSARGESALAWDEQANVVVLFGGTGPSGVLGDTFVLNGTTWSQPALAFGPPARFGHAMAYDRVRGGVVLFGGDVDDLSHTPPFGDTWLFKNNVWQDISASVGPGPGPRTHHQMTTDPISGRPLLFGGLKPGGVQDNVLWELADDGWRVVETLDAPPFVYRGVLVDDPVRKHVVLFGGNGRDEAYHLERAFGGRPAITFHVDLTPLGLSDAQIIEVGFSAVAGGEGIAATGASVPGATLELFRLGRWSRMAENDAPLGALAPLSTTGLTAYEALVGNSLHLALAARAENGAEAATVEVDHVEVRVRYLR